MDKLTNVVEKLCDASRKKYVNPYTYLEWPEHLDQEQWFISPQLISLYGTEFYEKLTEVEQKKLSFYEAINFFSLNIHGEKALISGLSQRLYEPDKSSFSGYLHHFLDEENKHMLHFGGFCTKYAGKIYRDKKIAFPREYEVGEEDFLFFAKVLIFEEIVDVYNLRMSQDESLVPLARQINLFHHQEEVRHLIFGRQIVKELFDRYSPSWSAETLQNLRQYLQNYFVGTWAEYYNPDVYKDAGLEKSYEIREKAFSYPQCRKHRQEVSAKCIRFFVDADILEEEPQL